MSTMTGRKKPIDPDLASELRAYGAARAAARVNLDRAEADLKNVVMGALESGASVRVVAETAGVAPVTVSKWKLG